MLSGAVSLRRLRFYESECRRGAAVASDAVVRTEFHKFAEAFGRAAKELQPADGDLLNEAGPRYSSPIGAYEAADRSV